MLPTIVFIDLDRTLARSAMPHAPVIPSLDARRSPGPARRTIAAMMRATADRLAPATAWPAG